MTISSRSSREIAPPSHRAWREAREDKYALLEARYSEWLKSLAEMEEVFKKRVYENENFSDADARQHRYHLCGLMTDGEGLAFDFLALDNGADVQSYVTLLDQKLGVLRHTLHAWHGAISDQNDIPESFKKGTAEIDAGKVVSMDEALSDKR